LEGFINDSPAGVSSLVTEFLAVRASLTYTPSIDRFHFAWQPLDASGGSVFRIMTDPAMLE